MAIILFSNCSVIVFLDLENHKNLTQFNSELWNHSLCCQYWEMHVFLQRGVTICEPSVPRHHWETRGLTYKDADVYSLKLIHSIKTYPFPILFAYYHLKTQYSLAFVFLLFICNTVFRKGREISIIIFTFRRLKMWYIKHELK